LYVKLLLRRLFQNFHLLSAPFAKTWKAKILKSQLAPKLTVEMSTELTFENIYLPSAPFAETGDGGEKKISKVISLLNLLHEMSVVLTFEDIYLPSVPAETRSRCRRRYGGCGRKLVVERGAAL